MCSVWEAVLLSITPSFVEIEKEKGSDLGRTLQEYKDEIDRPLSAILTLNTIAHTVGAIGVGAQAGKVLGGSDVEIAGMALPFSWETIIAVLMTLAILILSEIIPKTLGANYWKGLVPFTVKSLKVISVILFPFVWISQLITKALKKDKSKSVLSRADFSAIARVGEKTGAIAPSESRIIDNLLRFSSIRVKDIMTPRTVVKVAKEDMTIRDFYEENKKLRFSRIPIFKESKDHIVGFVMKDDILSKIIDKDGDLNLNSIMRKITVLNDNLKIQQAFDLLVEDKEHIALVVDEFGGTAGIVTMEDIMETLLGIEIVDEFDNVEDLQELARKNWKKRAVAMGIISGNEETTKVTS